MARAFSGDDHMRGDKRRRNAEGALRCAAAAARRAAHARSCDAGVGESHQRTTSAQLCECGLDTESERKRQKLRAEDERASVYETASERVMEWVGAGGSGREWMGVGGSG
eukprot:6201908-Pleurochrysis_carterae.AAC.3